MTFLQETDTKRIREFLDLVENHKVEIRHYKNPVLVWGVQEGTVYYSFWEADLLEKYGLQNVDGWDFEEDQLFCPDWMTDEDDDDYDLDDDDDAPICLPKIDFTDLTH
ncbi:MAG TPA: hypothetical protein PL124_01885 [Candidatus Cloacimonadota bacterium]|nr:hypothetical protein [Candidatus Cloacimonadota bacterium]HPS38143.1 hypothetical protein [Candidatus Cloacimonadota bacterium]